MLGASKSGFTFLGELWFGEFYQSIATALGFDQALDAKATDVLFSLLKAKSPSTRGFEDSLEKMIRGRTAVVFGAGPSLSSDLTGLLPFLEIEKPAIIAADGAADAIYAEEKLTPDIVVSDLDSCSKERLSDVSLKMVLFAHAHGDNIPLVERMIPDLGNNIIGTTQVAPVGSVRNYGGFADGDRACYIACHFEPSTLLLAGMDFGAVEGPFSRNRYDKIPKPNRSLKLEWSRRSLEYLIQVTGSKTEFRNMTKLGESVAGAKKTRYEDLI